ncbi:MAG: hypothetical protein ETSY1_30025 [Candidatus Entotheonella factor]|uniref:Major facilitator superfamily (MFS) profile domain-containing protein n=1 Tax=Entotheonella factor TaxID=1429438 RepID=W4LCC1_ENTF1|nr:MAG: hypothetical protein ETSY1_30025 [Candidatus Entotheonella factor]
MQSSPVQAPNKWLAATAILAGQLTISFGMFAVVVALPRIMTAFGADLNAIQWVMTGYLISRAVPMPALGWLSGLIGNRNLYIIGVLGATVCTARTAHGHPQRVARPVPRPSCAARPAIPGGVSQLLAPSWRDSRPRQR